MSPDEARRCGFVALIGRPNVGKSTLLNRLVGAKVSIVSDKPQTTRNRIVGVKTWPEGQIVLIDTPGIHRPLHRMNVRMRDTALRALQEVDVVGLVADASEPIGGGDRFVVGLLKDAGGTGLRADPQDRRPVLLVLNKIDRVSKPRLLPIIDHWRTLQHFDEIVPISAATGLNVDRLERVLLNLLPPGEPLYPEDYLTDQPERFFVAEIVREKLLKYTHAELPFTSAVIVEDFDDGHDADGAESLPGRLDTTEPSQDARRPAGLLRLRCTIIVERESQKGIVIGAGGEQIKRIGTEAREELERFFATKVFLDLRVKVRERWREDERLLDRMGLESSPGRHWRKHLM